MATPSAQCGYCSDVTHPTQPPEPKTNHTMRGTRFRSLGLGQWPAFVLFTLLVSTMFGCGTSGSAELRSVASPATPAAQLSAKLTTLAYTSSDVNTADIYMTDLPRAALEPEADLTGVSGVLVHLHLFITPLAGETPIANSACSATVRTVVIAEGNFGVYGGGGFLAPNESPGGSTFGGKVRDASCRISTKSPGFADRLGSAVFSSTFRVPKDAATSKLIERRLGSILASLPPPKPIETPRP